MSAVDRRGERKIRAYHVEGGEDVAVVVAGLEVFGDVGEGGQVVGILSGARDVADLVLGDDVLRTNARPRRYDSAVVAGETQNKQHLLFSADFMRRSALGATRRKRRRRRRRARFENGGCFAPM